MEGTTGNIAREALEETFRDVEKLIYSITHRFVRTHGGDFDEILSEACQGFLHVYSRWDSDRGSFTKYLYYHTWMRLLTTTTKEMKRVNRHCTFLPDLKQTIGFFTPTSHLLDGLGEDARQIIRMIFNLPTDLRDAFLEQDLLRAHGKRKAPSRRSVLHCYLRERGWSRKRIKLAFQNIQDQLK